MTDSVFALSLTMKHIRVEKGMTIETLASKTGIKSPTISAWESGRNEPRASDLIKLAGALGTSVDSLLGNGDRKAVKCPKCEGQGIVWEKKEA